MIPVAGHWIFNAHHDSMVDKVERGVKRLAGDEEEEATLEVKKRVHHHHSLGAWQGKTLPAQRVREHRTEHGFATMSNPALGGGDARAWPARNGDGEPSDSDSGSVISEVTAEP